MKRVFVCSPWREDPARGAEILRAVLRDVLREGDAPFAPHGLYPQVLDDALPEDRERGIVAGVAWLTVADEVLVVGPASEGMAYEVAAAEAAGVPVRRVPLPALEARRG